MGPHPLIESTSWYMDVLGFDLHLLTAAYTRPFGCIPEERNPHPPEFRADANIPKDSQLPPRFEHENSGGIAGYCGCANWGAPIHRQEESPISHIELFWHVSGQFTRSIVILYVGPLNQNLMQEHPAEALVH